MPTPSETQTLYKFGNGSAEDRPSVYANVWAHENLSGTERLIIAPRADHIDLLKVLLDAVPEPIWLLYVLVVTRGESEVGRYQSPRPLSREETTKFLADFGCFLESDGRQNLWVRSESGAAMLVYDRHNLIYAYGNLPEFVTILMRQGLTEVQQDSIVVPDPHSHHYHAVFDLDAERLLNSLEWQRTPLREQDKR
ncbi:MAG TPA: hypothetical protein VN682_20950 [Terriglobales bacterium]|nr:hypothetical protein [Terriglobales bacterium]